MAPSYVVAASITLAVIHPPSQDSKFLRQRIASLIFKDFYKRFVAAAAKSLNVSTCKHSIDGSSRGSATGTSGRTFEAAIFHVLSRQ